jgi:hypothetical protein
MLKVINIASAGIAAVLTTLAYAHSTGVVHHSSVNRYFTVALLFLFFFAAIRGLFRLGMRFFKVTVLLFVAFASYGQSTVLNDQLGVRTQGKYALLKGQLVDVRSDSIAFVRTEMEDNRLWLYEPQGAPIMFNNRQVFMTPIKGVDGRLMYYLCTVVRENKRYKLKLL